LKCYTGAAVNGNENGLSKEWGNEKTVFTGFGSIGSDMMTGRKAEIGLISVYS